MTALGKAVLFVVCGILGIGMLYLMWGYSFDKLSAYWGMITGEHFEDGGRSWTDIASILWNTPVGIVLVLLVIAVWLGLRSLLARR